MKLIRLIRSFFLPSLKGFDLRACDYWNRTLGSYQPKAHFRITKEYRK